jgi:hypothetical protein
VDLGNIQYKSINEDYNNVSIVTTEGEIRIVRNRTNFTNLEDYITDFDAKRHLIVSDLSRVSIGGYDALSRIVEFPDEKMIRKVYYIFVDYTVYIFATSSQTLYDDLDQIAQSFQYIP